jgi:1-acyl-sn-glycerol-3-phosphate acyltransferase
MPAIGAFDVASLGRDRLVADLVDGAAIGAGQPHGVTPPADRRIRVDGATLSCIVLSPPSGSWHTLAAEAGICNAAAARPEERMARAQHDTTAERASPLRWALSALYLGQAYAMMGLMGVVFVPWALARPRGALVGVQTWNRYARWSARWMLGLHTEVRGPVPTGEVLIAAKHQSFLDIIMIVSTVPHAKFVMKAELKRMPVLGWYALRMGCVPVERGRRAEAVRRMVADVEAGRADPGQLIIYPEGTRMAPGEHRPYKVGAAALYSASGLPCVPAACNVGLFWPRRGILRRAGTAVVEFLPEIEPGLGHDAFLARLEAEVEGGTERLLREAGWDGPPALRQEAAQ